ncbi:hypothetical protein KC946_02805 [Candidatus Saccharibacteria bacterium]|nr:hypothetical protein [Candidatus Saccharibacteria bacterium]
MSNEMPPINQQPSTSPAPEAGDNMDKLFDPAQDPANNPNASVEDAAVRQEQVTDSASREAERQMGISAADRKNREDAGLPPRVADLK